MKRALSARHALAAVLLCTCWPSTGGAVYFWVGPVGDFPVPNDTSLVISNCSFTDNRSWKDGGALSIYAPNVVITDSTFRGNRANNAGGAIEMLSERADAPLGRLVMRGCLLDKNSASTGGALSLHTDDNIGSLSVTIAGSRLVNNSAVRSNGGRARGGDLAAERSGPTAVARAAAACDEPATCLPCPPQARSALMLPATSHSTRPPSTTTPPVPLAPMSLHVTRRG